MPTIPAGSIEYLYVPVGVTEGTEPVSPTLVEIAIILRGPAPTEEEWATAEWIAGNARILLDGTRVAGSYAVWVRPTDSPERPIRLAGVLNLT